VATGEALLLARRTGIDLDVLRQALAASAACTAFARDDLGALIDGDYLTSLGWTGAVRSSQRSRSSPANSACHLS
jgi:3-hydroxyisobutyrate dehydrogenase-like beta-hydroxyacid dehydrogenase